MQWDLHGMPPAPSSLRVGKEALQVMQQVR